MSMPKKQTENLNKEISILTYGKDMTIKSINELSLRNFTDVEDYNKKYKYLKDLLQRITCELESMHNWVRIMNDKSVIADYLK